MGLPIIISAQDDQAFLQGGKASLLFIQIEGIPEVQ